MSKEIGKKVIFFLIDALAARYFKPALRAGELPNFQKLADAGAFYEESVAIFPSITPAATSSLITGHYPARHGIPGGFWYNQAEHKVIVYGFDIWVMLKQGVGSFLHEFLVDLNERRLQAPTLFELVEEAGPQAASLNFLIFHGRHEYTLDVPALLELLPGMEEAPVVHVPAIASFGGLMRAGLPENEFELKVPENGLDLLNVYDDNTIDLLLALQARERVPAFTVVYLPYNDMRSHEVGPEEAFDAVRHLDERLGEVFEAGGGVDRLLEQYCLIVTGDHAQSEVVAGDDAGIELSELLSDLDLAELGQPMSGADELVACPNLRAAQFYFNRPSRGRLERLRDLLLGDERVDQVIEDANLLEREQGGYVVHTRSRGELHFWPGEEGPHTARDVYGAAWSWEGDLGALDGRVEGDHITFGDYPNAFERIAGALDLESSAHLWATARPGHEFRLDGTVLHEGGGSHGSLHALDSLSPLIVAGAPDAAHLPEHPRAVDIAPLIMDVLGLSSSLRAGASHVAERS